MPSWFCCCCCCTLLFHWLMKVGCLFSWACQAQGLMPTSCLVSFFFHPRRIILSAWLFLKEAYTVLCWDPAVRKATPLESQNRVDHMHHCHSSHQLTIHYAYWAPSAHATKCLMLPRSSLTAPGRSKTHKHHLYLASTWHGHCPLWGWLSRCKVFQALHSSVLYT